MGAGWFSSHSDQNKSATNWAGSFLVAPFHFMKTPFVKRKSPDKWHLGLVNSIISGIHIPTISFVLWVLLFIEVFLWQKHMDWICQSGGIPEACPVAVREQSDQPVWLWAFITKSYRMWSPFSRHPSLQWLRRMSYVENRCFHLTYPFQAVFPKAWAKSHLHQNQMGGHTCLKIQIS